MKKLWLGMVVASLAIGLVSAGSPGKTKATDPATVTVGDFAVKVAVAIGADAATEKAAVASLKAAGVRFNEPAGTRLTEGMAARMLLDLGLKVEDPKNSRSPVSAGVADALASRVALTTQSRARGTSASTQAPPVDCLHSSNNGQCVNCCVHEGFKGNYCTNFCKANEPPHPSDSVPTP